MIQRTPLLVLFACCHLLAATCLRAQSGLDILPLPATMTKGSGQVAFPDPLTVHATNPKVAEKAINSLREAGFANLRMVETPEQAFLHFKEGTGGSGAEAYGLSVNANGAFITGESTGCFYGTQTLLQLLFQAKGSKSDRIPHVEIQDAPRFAWRGMHLDVSRHFFPVDYVKKYIDVMAHFKLNTFHWHLTDDQGWRIEIKKYPKLTQVGAQRRETLVGHWNDQPHQFDGKKYSGFYTQEQIRDIVAYAEARCVTIVPEIEMPGHATAALFAYPEFSCDNHRPTEVARLWGVFNGVFKPTEQTFQFIDDILGEVCALFPGKYIHIGGDEVPKEPWTSCPSTQAIMKAQGITDAHALQSYFIGRVEKMLLKRQRLLIGWDEILEGGLAPEATVMSWRGESGGIAAAKARHNVVMTPGFALYFDHYQGAKESEPLAIGGLTPIREVYEYDPVPAALTPAEAQYILGAQANVWTEYIPRPDQADYMAYPRALALAEITWAPKGTKDYDDFMRRLSPQLATLHAKKVFFRVPEPLGVEAMAYATMGGARNLDIKAPIPNAKVMIMDGGRQGTPKEAESPCRFTLDFGQTKDYMAYTMTADMRRSPPVRFSMTHQNPLKGTKPNVEPKPGVQVTVFEKTFASTREMDNAAAAVKVEMEDLAYPGPAPEGTDARAAYVSRLFSRTPVGRAPVAASPIGLEFNGLIKVEFPGIYTFYLSSDDGSSLSVGGQPLLDNDGTHSVETRKVELALDPGFHPIQLRYFNAGGDGLLDLQWEGPNLTKSPVKVFQQ